jgi:molybdopterin molybdotransferase
MSVGPRDLVRAALAAAGARLDFWRVAIRPGKPFTFGLWDHTAVFGVPGNPASALVTFEIFVRPALRALGGLPGSGRLTVEASLAEGQAKPPGLTVYTRVRLVHRQGGLEAVPLRTQTSGDLASAAGHDGLAILPAGRDRISRGTRVQVLVVRAPAG